MEDTPQYRVEVDREKARALSLSLDAVNRTLSTAWGSAYVNDYIENGRIKKVYVQGDARFRMQPSDLGRWYVRNENGQMGRSEERRVGTECVSTCSSRGAPNNNKKKNKK